MMVRRLQKSACQGARILIGGYAVAYHGYVQAMADLDAWIPRERSNSERPILALKVFGFYAPELVPDLVIVRDQILRMGNPPMRFEINTDIDGVQFDELLLGQ